MGGGASLMEGVEELVTTTILIGRAISAMTFPGMYRIYDFHSKKAPRLKNVRNFTFFGPDSEEDEENDHETDIDPSDYSHFFKVTVNGDDVYIEDPLEPNEAGWTPLHTCCMSLSTVSAGLTLIEEIVRRGGSFELKTIQGPGTFNRGWTPLQMACAYGIDPLVEKLVESGADPNAVNSFGYSCLLEGCHRGFADIVRTLLKSKVDLSYIPDPQVAGSSPFMSAPCQSALGESARCGFHKIVQMIIDAGANKNLPNHLGWTPLHEACFYHRVETVKTLLLAGADPTLRTNLGALPYHLTGLNEIRGMLESMGGAGAVPAEGDTIDMVKVLTELTMLDGTDKDELNETPENHHSMIMSSGFSQMPIVLIPLSSIDSTSSDPHRSDIDRKNFETSSPRRTDSKSLENKSCNDLAGTLLHSGRVLGNLPALTPGKSPTKNLSSELDRALTLNERHNSNILSASHGADPKSSSQKKLINNNVAEDFPKQYLCQLTQKPMSCPVKTIYGNIYDKDAILNWFSQQGRICPLTGAPLAEIDLSPLPELESEIRQYILKKSLQKENLKDESSRRRNENKNPTTEDLYDF